MVCHAKSKCQDCRFYSAKLFERWVKVQTSVKQGNPAKGNPNTKSMNGLTNEGAISRSSENTLLLRSGGLIESTGLPRWSSRFSVLWRAGNTRKRELQHNAKPFYPFLSFKQICLCSPCCLCFGLMQCSSRSAEVSVSFISTHPWAWPFPK